MKNRIFKKFTLFDLVLIAMLAALGVAIKTVVVPLVHIITGPLFIPGGSVAGGIYMMFLVIAVFVVQKPMTAILLCGVQTVMVLVTGVLGSHGVLSIVTYMLPGIGVEVLFFLLGRKLASKEACFSAGVIANILGTILVNIIFFRLPIIPLMLSLAVGALSGGLGGLAAYAIGRQVRKLSGAVSQKKDETEDIDISKQDEEDKAEEA